MRILARHKWVSDAVITESVDESKREAGRKSYRRFTATINGWRGWKIYQGHCFDGMAEMIRDKVREIKDKIEQGDEEIFKLKGYFLEAK